MIGGGDTGKVCKAIADDGLRKACESAAKKCTEDHCSESIDFCASNDSWPAKIVTEKNGDFSGFNPLKCMSLVKMLAGKGYTIVSMEPNEPSPPVPDDGASETSNNAMGPVESASEETGVQSEPEEQAEPHSEGGAQASDAADDATVGAEPGPAPEANCDSLKGDAVGFCTDIAKKCASNTEWPLVLETTSGPFGAPDKAKCMKLAKLLAGKGLSLDKPDAESTTAAGATTNAGSSHGPVSPEPQAAPESGKGEGKHFVKSFSDANLVLKVKDGKYVEVSRVLHFKGGKGIPIKMEYALERLEDASYLMKYTIYKGKKPIGDEQSIGFEAPGGEINLGFEIVLHSKNDFGSIESIRIVDLG